MTRLYPIAYPLVFIALAVAAYAEFTPTLPNLHPQPAPERVYVVDRIEGDYAVMIDDVTAKAVDVHADVFPFTVREGLAVVVPIGPQWTQARRVTR